MIELDRPLVVAYRAWVQGLHGEGLDVLHIGVQDAPSGSADLGLAVRANDPRAADDPALVRVLSIRGAPHVHRREDLPRLRAELRPRRPEDLLAWLGGHGQSFVDSGVDVMKVVDRLVELMINEFPGERATKGELSGVVSPRLPEPARPWCEGCRSHHVIDGLFRLGAFLAGIELERGDRRLTFRRPQQPPPDSKAPQGVLVRQFVRLTGPVHADDVRTWLDAGGPAVAKRWTAPGWPEVAGELDEVRVDGRSLLMRAADVDAIEKAPPPPPVVLLPPRDPYLNGNRALVVPEREIAKRVWRAQVSPGVLLIDGEIGGIWRQRASGRTIDLHVTPFGKPGKGIKPAVEDRAELVGAVRGAGATVVWED